MPLPIPGQIPLEVFFGAILFASLLPIVGKGMFALNPSRKIKILIVVLICVSEVLLLAFVSVSIGSFLKGLFCLLSGGIPLLFLFYIFMVYQYRVAFPLRDQYIKDLFDYRERKKAKEDTTK